MHLNDVRKLIIFRPDGESKNTQNVSGISVDIIKELAAKLGFRVIFFYGGFDIKVFTRWIGKHPKIATGRRAEMGVPGAPTEQITKMISYSNYLYFNKLIFTSRIPIPKPIQGRGIAKPFGIVIWICIFVTTGIFALIFVVVYHIYSKINPNLLGKLSCQDCKFAFITYFKAN